MNESIKRKINRIGLYGMILAIVMIIASAIIFTYHFNYSIPGFQTLHDPHLSSTFPSILVSCICGMLCAIGEAVAYGFLLRVSKKLRRCDTPFEGGVIRSMTVFGWVLFGVSILSAVFNVLTGVYYNSVLSSLVNLLPSFSLVFSLIVLFLVRVFRHGAELQKERDETL